MSTGNKLATFRKIVVLPSSGPGSPRTEVMRVFNLFGCENEGN